MKKLILVALLATVACGDRVDAISKTNSEPDEYYYRSDGSKYLTYQSLHKVCGINWIEDDPKTGGEWCASGVSTTKEDGSVEVSTFRIVTDEREDQSSGGGSYPIDNEHQSLKACLNHLKWEIARYEEPIVGKSYCFLVKRILTTVRWGVDGKVLPR